MYCTVQTLQYTCACASWSYSTIALCTSPLFSRFPSSSSLSSPSLSIQYGDNHLKEVESLWCALCTWPQNIRATLNYLAHLTCVSGNVTLMLHQAKRVMVCFSQRQTATIVTELMRDLQVCVLGRGRREVYVSVTVFITLLVHAELLCCHSFLPLSLLCPSFPPSLPTAVSTFLTHSQSVEMISAEVQILDAPHFHSQSRTGGAEASIVGNDVGQRWAVEWRRSVRMQEGRAVPLPLPPDKRRFASMRELLKASTRPLGALHRYKKGGEGGREGQTVGRWGGERVSLFPSPTCTSLFPLSCLTLSPLLPHSFPSPASLFPLSYMYLTLSPLLHVPHFFPSPASLFPLFRLTLSPLPPHSFPSPASLFPLSCLTLSPLPPHSFPSSASLFPLSYLTFSPLPPHSFPSPTPHSFPSSASLFPLSYLTLSPLPPHSFPSPTSLFCLTLSPLLPHSFPSPTSLFPLSYLTFSPLLPHSFPSSASLFPLSYLTFSPLPPHSFPSSASLFPLFRLTLSPLPPHSFPSPTSQVQLCSHASLRAGP